MSRYQALQQVNQHCSLCKSLSPHSTPDTTTPANGCVCNFTAQLCASPTAHARCRTCLGLVGHTPSSHQLHLVDAGLSHTMQTLVDVHCPCGQPTRLKACMGNKHIAAVRMCMCSAPQHSVHTPPLQSPAHPTNMAGCVADKPSTAMCIQADQSLIKHNECMRMCDTNGDNKQWCPAKQYETSCTKYVSNRQNSSHAAENGDRPGKTCTATADCILDNHEHTQECEQQCLTRTTHETMECLAAQQARAHLCALATAIKAPQCTANRTLHP